MSTLYIILHNIQQKQQFRLIKLNLIKLYTKQQEKNF